MNPSDSFIVASNSQRVAGWVFWLIALISVTLLLYPGSKLDSYLQPVLVVLSIVGLVSGFVTMVYQNRGNHFLRASQLANHWPFPLEMNCGLHITTMIVHRLWFGLQPPPWRTAFLPLRC